MAVNALKTFPSAVEGMPRGFFPSGSYGSGSSAMDMGRTDNSIHQSGMEWAKRYVNARARIMSHNDRVMERGGYRNALPKPQPQGSFLRLQTNSGSNAYGGGMGMTGRGGTFRTKSGAEYGRRKLRERGEQLAEQQIASEEGFPVGMKAPTEPVPLDKEDTDLVALDLFFNQLINSYEENTEMPDIKVEDINKFFNSLRTKTGLSLDTETLMEMRSRMLDIVNNMLSFAEGEDGFADIPTPRSKIVAIARVFYLLTALVESVNIAPADRKKYVSAQVKRISRSIRTPDDITEDPIQSVPNNLRRLAPGEIKDRLEESEAEAPEVILARFVPDPTKREQIVRDYQTLLREGNDPVRAFQIAQRLYAEREGEAMREGEFEEVPEMVMASAVPTSMRPAGVAPAMPEETMASATSRRPPSPDEEEEEEEEPAGARAKPFFERTKQTKRTFTPSQKRFLEIVKEKAKSLTERFGKSRVVEVGNPILQRMKDRARGKQDRGLDRLANEWVRETQRVLESGGGDDE